jgi:DNA-binding PadR family transcriptional regulator
MIEYILLGFLMERDMTGYDMKQHMSISTAYFVDASFGSIYPALKRLEKKGFVEFNELIENGKLKKIYAINEQGKEQFLKWLASPITMSRTDSSFPLAKIFFFRYLPREQAGQLIEQCIQDLLKYKKSLLELRSKVEDKADMFELCTLDYGLDSYDFAIHWCEKNLLENLK